MIASAAAAGGSALAGLLATHFAGKWISTPDATYRASDKIGQLDAARVMRAAVQDWMKSLQPAG
jgi:hypothetical protein